MSQTHSIATAGWDRARYQFSKGISIPTPRPRFRDSGRVPGLGKKTIRDEIKTAGITVTDDFRLFIFLTSSMPSKYAMTIQLWDTMRQDGLTADRAISMPRHNDQHQKQENEISDEKWRKEGERSGK